MTTIHEEAAQAVLEQYMQDPAAAAVLVEKRRAFAASDYDEGYTAWIGQTQRNPKYWPLEQVAAYLRIHTGLMSGEFGHVLIAVGDTPGPDADRADNAAKLRGVHKAFRAELDLWQNGANRDGRLRWDVPIEVEKSANVALLDEAHGATPVRLCHRLGPGSVPLEVGYSKPSCTLLHLLRHGGVARWAYDDAPLPPRQH